MSTLPFEVITEDEENKSPLKTYEEMCEERRNKLNQKKIYIPWKKKNWIYDNRNWKQYLIDAICFAWYTGKRSGETCFQYADVHKEEEERIIKIQEQMRKEKTNHEKIRISTDVHADQIEKLIQETENIKRDSPTTLPKKEDRYFEICCKPELKIRLDELSKEAEKIRIKINFGRSLNDVENGTLFMNFVNELINSYPEKERKKFIKNFIKKLEHEKELTILC